MITNSVICLSDRDRAREIALRHYRGYLYSLVCLYHDTMPEARLRARPGRSRSRASPTSTHSTG